MNILSPPKRFLGTENFHTKENVRLELFPRHLFCTVFVVKGPQNGIQACLSKQGMSTNF